MIEKMKPKLVVFDFNRTIYDPEKGRVIEGAINVLEKLLPKFPMVLYCKTGDGRGEKIKELGIEKYFKRMVFVEKKSPRDLLKLAKEFNIGPGEILVIGDRVRSEIAAAKQAGCKTIWFRQGKFAGEEPAKKEEEPDQTIIQLKDLLSKTGKAATSAKL